ncbi:Chromosome segregation in meiosis protein 3 [Frankliniella fusca]|uniref:Chromosome segregation in meiosis protein 3 n=1 Tax=Frankliniella fusca TaxID=407009 RepID=A0AAE1LUN3_9NEOP|nr:Chromosome segregation in meiosis protein 3 [Frankliniella fusca]
MEIHRIVVQQFVGLQIGDPTFRRLVLQNDVFSNGLYRAEDFYNTPLVPQIPPPGIVYPGGLVAEPEYVDLTMED